MNGIPINIDPVILHIGPFELRWYSLMIIAAVLVGMAVALREGKRKGFSPDDLYSLLPWLLVGGIVGARLFHVIDRFGYYASNPGLIVQFQQGGLAIWGAVAGGAIAAVIYARLKHIPLGFLFDTVTPGLLLAQMTGRLGCIINGDAYGGITTLPWGFIYNHENASIPVEFAKVPTHPYPVYEIIWDGMVLLLLLKVRQRFAKDGFLFLSYLSLYSLGRFILTFVRQEKIWFWGLQEAQIVSLGIMVVAVAVLAYKSRDGLFAKAGSQPAQNQAQT